MLGFYPNPNQLTLAFQVFEDMQNRGMRGDGCSYATLITCCERAKDWRKAEEARAGPDCRRRPIC